MEERVDKILREIDRQGNDGCPSHAFFCPGCQGGHAYWTTGPVAWKFNGDMEKPTFEPSLLIYGWKAPDGTMGQPRCHLYVRDGQIQFLDDCEHGLKGQTVPMQPF